MTKVNQLDFTGTIIFCGLDVHKLSWRVNIRDFELELKDFTQPADAHLLHKHLTKNYPGARYKVGYKAGFCGFGIQRELSLLGKDCILLNAADIPKGDKDRRQKNDKRDARSISQLLSTKKDLKSLYIFHLPPGSMPVHWYATVSNKSATVQDVNAVSGIFYILVHCLFPIRQRRVNTGVESL